MRRLFHFITIFLKKTKNKKVSLQDFVFFGSMGTESFFFSRDEKKMLQDLKYIFGIDMRGIIILFVVCLKMLCKVTKRLKQKKK
jgi:hypothetical protein